MLSTTHRAYVVEIPPIQLLKSKYIKSKTRCRYLVHMGQTTETFNHRTCNRDNPKRVLAHQLILGQKVTVRVRVIIAWQA